MGEPDSRSVDMRGPRLAMLAVSAAVGLWALWGIGTALRSEPKIWGLLGFEVVALLAGALGVLGGLGRPREAPALTAACAGATIFAAATLGRFSAIVTQAEGALSGGQALGRLARDPVFEGRVLAAGALGVISLVFALGRDRAAWRQLVAGVALGLPVVAATGWLLLGSGLAWVLAPAESFLGIVRIIGTVLGAIALVILASVSADRVIGAFEMRLPPLPGGVRPARRAGEGKTG